MARRFSRSQPPPPAPPPPQLVLRIRDQRELRDGQVKKNPVFLLSLVRLILIPLFWAGSVPSG
jgi:hypothetical protein